MKICLELSKILLLIVFVSTGCLSQTIEKPSESAIIIAGVKDKVTVRKDSRGIPYIDANSDEDLYFVQGFITASDRLWQMDLLRRVAGGRTAELFGKVTLEEDKRWRRFGFQSIVDQSYKGLSPEFKSVLDCYARGVNAYIATLNKDTMPSEFRILQYQPEQWKATDSLLIGKILSDALSTSWFEDTTRAKFSDLPKKRFDELFIEKTPFDVLVVGKDDPQPKEDKRAVHFVNHAVSASLDKIGALEESIRKSSLERAGF